MHIQFCGAARTVTGSMHIIELNGERILLDCGLFQGKRKEAFEQNRKLPFDPRTIDHVILSHAHIDHSGNLPQLVKGGFGGTITCTEATHDLCKHMLLDSAHIQEKDVEYVNKKRIRQRKTPFEPLYTIRDAEAALRRFEGVPYDAEFGVGKGARAIFRDAGHILGSATVHLDLRENGATRRLVFTGDLGRPSMPILRNPVPVEEADFLICESTYGNRLHGKEVALKEELREAVTTAFRRKGKVLIPAFSVGRTQNIIYFLHQLHLEGRLPPLPIFVDSPLSSNATNVFRHHPECFDEEARTLLTAQGDPFGFDQLTYVHDQHQSMLLNQRPGPFIIISASGMCEAGRVIHHLKYIAPHPENLILIVGFMAENTLGRRIAEKVKTIKLYGELYLLRAEVRSLEGFSAHADRDEILDFLAHLRRLPERTFIVHGEPDQAEGLKRELGGHGFRRVEIPSQGQRFDLAGRPPAG